MLWFHHDYIIYTAHSKLLVITCFICLFVFLSVICWDFCPDESSCDNMMFTIGWTFPFLSDIIYIIFCVMCACVCVYVPYSQANHWADLDLTWHRHLCLAKECFSQGHGQGLSDSWATGGRICSAIAELGAPGGSTRSTTAELGQFSDSRTRSLPHGGRVNS